MRVNRLAAYLLFLAIVPALSAQWPHDLEKYKSSMCLVEFFLPQYESGEIKDDSRIKWTISGILVREDGLVITPDVIFPANLDILGRGGFFSSTQSPPENITVAFEKEKKQKHNSLSGKWVQRQIFSILCPPSAIMTICKRFFAQN